MPPPSLSLRARLMVLILIPLTVISILAAAWRISTATETTRQVFDRTLVALTLAISRDVVISGGDALSATTKQMMQDALGGQLYYHVYGPDGAFITGYATPPVMPPGVALSEDAPILFESHYRGEVVRVARLREHSAFGPVIGFSSITVWQTMAARETFLTQQAHRAIALIATLFLTVAAVIWFGINLGLKPLAELQDAIAQRNSDDLSKIRRPVPPEVTGVVATLNALFGQVSAAIASRDRFISDAAHQLRNPIAGLLSMAEAARDAKRPEDRLSRSHEVVAAARHASRLTNQLLTLERAKGVTDTSRLQPLEVNSLVREVCERNADKVLERNLAFSFHPCEQTATVQGDEVLLQEAVQNLIDNAMMHGGPGNTEIRVTVTADNGRVSVQVSDKGAGLRVQDSETAFARFGQIGQGEGSGLGLAIVAEIAELHGGETRIEPCDQGAAVAMTLPMVSAVPGED